MTNANDTTHANDRTSTRLLQAELTELLSGVQAEEQRETDAARAAYRALLFRLARDERGEADTPAELHRIAKEAGRTAGQLVADVTELRELVGLASEASQLTQRRKADHEASAALVAGQEKFEQTLKQAKARVAALERARHDSLGALYAADDARRKLIARLGLADHYQAKLWAQATAEARLERSRGTDEELGAQAEVEGCRREVWSVYTRATTLDDYTPFRGAPRAVNAPPLAREDPSWNQPKEAKPTAE